MKLKKKKTSRFQMKRALKIAEAAHGNVDALVCFHKKCDAPALALDECITCEKLGKSTRIFSCGEHRQAGLNALRKHALVKHPANLLRVIAAGLKGEEI